MILPDVNVLIYAFRRDSHDHLRYRRWLESVVNGAAAYGMSPQVLSAVVRITTHRRVYKQPSSLDEAFGFARVMMAQPHCVIVQPGGRHWMLFQQLCRDGSVSGNLVQDAWFAALAIESGSEWITTDRDYARFRSLKWRTPF